MRYLLAFIIPQLADFLYGKPHLVILNIFLTLMSGVPVVLLALLAGNTYLADEHTEVLTWAVRVMGR